ncbi:ABC-three component system middle component 6 [Bradyrhizobium guangzhouense]|uniref:ABC-three component system middle component 6 n=1 Tax=Bradyrhizobium guangzhouense TaxID=1325095 RepID=UPI001025DC21|nr:hypothetical protein EAS54_30250 [Bradyrhizobium guangzhouense]
MTFFPTKYVPLDASVLGVASILLSKFKSNDTVSTLWDRVRMHPQIRTFDRYAEALTLLFAANLIDIRNGILVQSSGAGRTI